jgi:hypothetical protein
MSRTQRCACFAVAGGSWSLQVTAVDQYGNAWDSGDPDFVLQCLQCSQLIRTASGAGRSSFEGVIRVAGSQTVSVYTSGSGQLVANLQVAVSAAAADVLHSSVDGPFVATAGQTVIFSFTPRDVYGNVALLNATTGASLAFAAVLREVTAVADVSGNEVAAQAINLDMAAQQYALEFVTTIAGKYSVVVSMGQLYRGLRPEARHGPVQVTGGPPAASRTVLTVRFIAVVHPSG